ncbi:MAG TPA: hypothetical protein VM100_03310 [Longimicrobiales bacterium]|nr:hypothetical protein [Longimicrobiales bacterium]
MNRSWRNAWILALAVVAIVTIAYETFLRLHNYIATVQDDADLWSIQYDRVKRDPRSVALLGASRIQYAVDPALLSKILGGRTVAMLPINGQYPLAALRDLAENRNFAGLAIVGIDARGLARRHWDMQQPYIDHYYERWSRARWLHRQLASVLQQHVVFLHSPFSLANMARRFVAGFGLPFNDYVVLRPDRVGFLDYTRTNVAAIRARRIADLNAYYQENPPPDAQSWLRDLAQVSQWVRQIRARGGQVVFFREPATDEHLDIDEAHFPREQYWDAYARVSPGMMIEFRDEPVFATFLLPDSSHIAGADVPRFTLALAQTLERHKIVPPIANWSPGATLGQRGKIESHDPVASFR